MYVQANPCDPYRPYREDESTRPAMGWKVTYEFEVKGCVYSGTSEIPEMFSKWDEKPIIIYYDPNEPKENCTE